MTGEVRFGGCQCGAVRYRVEGALGDASVCHCRMCQKASGGFYMSFVSTRPSKLTWTRGERKRFASSNHVFRSFCGDCGTPLTYEASDGLSVAIATFDDPATIAPVIQWGTEAKLPYVDGVADLPEQVTMDDIAGAPFLATLVSNQHPDHETDQWPATEQTR